MAFAFDGLAQVQHAPFDGECVPWPDHVHVVRLDGQAVHGLLYGEPGMSGEDLRQQGFRLRRQVLDQHERHARILGHGIEKIGE